MGGLLGLLLNLLLSFVFVLLALFLLVAGLRDLLRGANLMLWWAEGLMLLDCADQCLESSRLQLAPLLAFFDGPLPRHLEGALPQQEFGGAPLAAANCSKHRGDTFAILLINLPTLLHQHGQQCHVSSRRRPPKCRAPPRLRRRTARRCSTRGERTTRRPQRMLHLHCQHLKKPPSPRRSTTEPRHRRRPCSNGNATHYD
mmetsp:Transcript_173376/g.556126  ORF Transcript_173376/g.556126 Transcript_173376/m.556126 type:complete len:200 (-) Transcript_173376:865-1464(-)